MNARQILTYAMIAFVIFVFVQSLFYKFSGSEQTDIIFNTIAQWMTSVGLGFIAPAFAAIGGYVIGGSELIASALLIKPGTRKFGALLGLALMSGAIFFHLFTPLGVDRKINAAGDTDGGVLFFMACGVWLCCAVLYILSRKSSNN